MLFLGSNLIHEQITNLWFTVEHLSWPMLFRMQPRDLDIAHKLDTLLDHLRQSLT